MKQNKRSFTLVEILMVTGIICLIAALILVAYNGVYQSWSTGNTAAAMKAAHLALDKYMLENGSYPKQETADNLENVAGADTRLSRQLLQDCAPYSNKKSSGKVEIFDDFGKKAAIKYVFPVSNSSSFALISAGKDGSYYTEDDIIYLPGGTTSIKPGFYTGKTTSSGGLSDYEPIAQ